MEDYRGWYVESQGRGLIAPFPCWVISNCIHSKPMVPVAIRFICCDESSRKITTYCFHWYRDLIYKAKVLGNLIGCGYQEQPVCCCLINKGKKEHERSEA